MSVAETLSDRMKEYEKVTEARLIKKQPVIIRLDGKTFHTFTQGIDKPFDEDLADAFEFTCVKLKEKVQGAKLIYTQSDEISILLTDWEKTTTDCWFDYRIQKVVSIASSLATCFFNQYIDEIVAKYYKKYNQKDISYEEEQLYLKKYQLWRSKKYKANFDARIFNLPISEIANYFIYRQKDAIRNSIQSLGQAHFSHKELNKKNTSEVIQMVKDKVSIDFNELSSRQQKGICLYRDFDTEKWIIDKDIPDFLANREYIEKYVR